VEELISVGEVGYVPRSEIAAPTDIMAEEVSKLSICVMTAEPLFQSIDTLVKVLGPPLIRAV
jgi:hypothetical protein